MPGKAELARIHILKKEAGIADGEYRDLLSGAAGVGSAADIETPDQYYKVVSALEKYIASIGGAPSGRRAARAASLPEAVLGRAERILGPGYRGRLAGYLRKMGREDLGGCSERELRRVMGFLSSVEKKGAGAGAQNPGSRAGRARQGREG